MTRSASFDIHREALRLLGGVLSLLILTHSGFDNSEANYHYLISQRIIHHGQLSFPVLREGPFIVAPNGRTYGAHELGNSLALLPVAVLNDAVERVCGPRLGPAKTAMATRFLFAMMGPAICSIASTLLFLTLRLVFLQSTRAATLNVFAFLFCSFYWTYSRSIFDGVLCSALLTGAMLLLFRYAHAPDRPGLLVGAFVCLGFGLITRLSMALAILAALAYLWSVPKRLGSQHLRQVAAICTVISAPFIAWQLYYNYLRTGSAFITPGLTAKFASEIGLTGNLFAGISGLLFSPGKSIFVYCPATLLSIVVFRRFHNRYRSEALFVAVLALSWLALHARLQSWYGSWGWGPRHFITIVPCLVLPFLVMRTAIRARAFQWLSAVLLSFGFLLGLASIITNYHYRLGLAVVEHRIADRYLVWSPRQNQAVDVLFSAASNLRRLLFGGAYDVLPHASQIDVIGSNTLNLWLVNAHLAGVPLLPLALIAALLLGISGGAFYTLLRPPRRDGHVC